MAALDVLDMRPHLVVKLEDGGSHKIPFMDVYCQISRGDLVTFEDLVMTAIAWQKVLSQELIYRFIEVRDSPHPDRSDGLNRAILQDMVGHYATRGVHSIKSADCWSGTQGADGYIEFEEPFIGHFSGCSIDALLKDIACKPSKPIWSQCTYFPLEIGYCSPDQLEQHLSISRCVARFPYGSEYIVFLESTADALVIPDLSDQRFRSILTGHSGL